jgi:hypothetical protein
LVCDKWEYPSYCSGNSGLPCNVVICRHWSWICGDNRV